MCLPRERWAIWAVAAVSVLYWICAGVRAAYKPFWYDEIVTWHVARLPNVGAIWAALHEGVDHETPLTHLAVRLAHQLFGTGHLATRLPALTGFWIMSLAIYAFLRRRLPLPYALIGMTFPMLTFAWLFAFEARAYGVILGCGAVGLVAWQNVAEGQWRRLSLAGIGISLAFGLGSHPFSVLNAVPLAFGEGMRTLERKRLDPWVWLAMAAGALGLLTFPGSIQAARDWDMTGLQPSFSELPGFYDAAFRTVIAPMLFAALAVCAFTRRPRMQSVTGPILPRHETAALLGFVVAPLVFFLASFVTDRFVFSLKYGILTVIGMACGSAVVIFRATGGDRRAGTVLLAVILAWLAAARGHEAFAMTSAPRFQFEDKEKLLIQALATGKEVVAISPLTFLAADFYLSTDTLRHVNYVTADRKTARRFRMQDLADQLVIRSAQVLPVRAHVEGLGDFAVRHRNFLLHTDDSYRCVVDVLLRDGWRLTLVDRRAGATLFDVNAPEEHGSEAGGAASIDGRR